MNSFYIKNQFLYLFTYFICSLDWASNSRKVRGYYKRISKTQNLAKWTAGSIFLFPEDSLAKCTT
jgi:hypothetical protein